MKQIFIVLLLVAALASCTDPSTNGEAKSTNSHLSEREIEVLLPERMTVNKTDGVSQQGRLEAMDDRTLTLAVAGDSIPILLAEIESVELSGEVRFYSTGEPVIRGDRNGNESDTPQEFTVPIGNFRVGERGENMAIVDLTPVDNYRGFTETKDDRYFIVDDMEFEPSGNPEQLRLEISIEMR